MRRLVVAVVVACTVMVGMYPSSGVASGYDWLQFGFDQQHSGNNPSETTIAAANAAQLKKLFTAPLPSVADGAPAYVSSVSTPQGVKDLVFLTTKDGHILALDAQSGTQVWAHQYGPGSCTINKGGAACYTTSSPAIDPSRLYVYSYGLDGYVHKYQVGDGTEILAGGWPEQTTLKNFDEKGSSALSIATASTGTNYLYMANGGYPGDNGDYQGHNTAINLSTGTQHVFNTLCSNQTVHFVEQPNSPDCPEVQSAVWARPGAIYDSATGKIYISTGNGTYAPSSFDWGDSVLALNPDGKGSGNGNPLDSYTPADFQNLQNTDADLGSTDPAILPVPPGSNVQHLAVQGGKDAELRLLNLDNLSGQSGPGHVGGEVGSAINFPQGGEVLTQPAVWVNPSDGNTWVFVANGSGISGFQLMITNGTPSLHPVWTSVIGGSSPVIANGVLFYAGNSDLRALDPVTGSPLWTSSAIGGVHWESPIVANGTVYMTDESGKLNAFNLPSSPTPTNTSTNIPTSTPTSTPLATSGGVLTVASTQQYMLTGSDGSNWQDIDSNRLSLSFTPSVDEFGMLSGTADLFTSSSGYNQDFGIWISGGTYGSGQLVAWKESGGFAGTFSPNAAFVQSVVHLSAGTTYTVKLRWKANKADTSTIWAGAGPIKGNYSPTRLTARLLPTSNNSVSSASSTRQYTLTKSDGSTWNDMDSNTLNLTLSPTVNSDAVLSGNADLFTSLAGYNQDFGIWISGGSYGSGKLVAWKESGGFAGTFSPNAAFVQTVVHLSAGTAYTVKLQWKVNKADNGTIWAGAGPLNGSYSPTRLTAMLLPSVNNSVSTASSTSQYTLVNSDGSTWKDMDSSTLKLVLSPNVDSDAVLSGNADLFTSVVGYNQDFGIWISGGSYGSGQLVAWKESGGFAGTFSPNAAYVQTVVHLSTGTAYTIKLEWKANKAGTGSIWAGAGPMGGHFSPTSLTSELVPTG